MKRLKSRDGIIRKKHGGINLCVRNGIRKKKKHFSECSLPGSLRIGSFLVLDWAIWHSQVNLGQKCFGLQKKPSKIYCHIHVSINMIFFPLPLSLSFSSLSLIINEGYLPASDAHRIVQSNAANKPIAEWIMLLIEIILPGKVNTGCFILRWLDYFKVARMLLHTLQFTQDRFMSVCWWVLTRVSLSQSW